MRIIVITRKQFACGVIILLILIGVFAALPMPRLVRSVTGNQKTVVIDAGHGSVDPGCTYRELKEKEINLQVAFLLKEILEKANIRVVMTRTDDSLYQQSRREDILYRVRKANEVKPDAFISIHVNKFPSEKPFGGQAYYYSGPASKNLAEKIQEQLKIIQSNNYREIGVGDYYVLRKTACPAVLVEIGFISNAADRERMTNPDEQRRIANAIFTGLDAFFNEKLTATVNPVDVVSRSNLPKLAAGDTGYDLYFISTSPQGEELVPLHQALPSHLSIPVHTGTDEAFLELAAREAIRALIGGPGHSGLTPVIPAGTKLLSLTVNDGLATVNFNQNLTDNHWGGAKTEYLTVAAIVKTLTAFPGIDRVQILVEGKVGQTIAGHIIFDEPFASDTFH